MDPGILVHEQDVDVDLDFAPADDGNVEPPLNDAKDRVIIRITGVIVDWLVKVAPKVYALYVATNSKGINNLLVECYNSIYGTMVAGLLCVCVCVCVYSTSKGEETLATPAF